MSLEISFQLQEGKIQAYQCKCKRKTGILKKWTDVKLAVEHSRDTSWRLVDYAHSKEETIFDVAEDGKNIAIEWVEDDPHHPDKFLGVVINNRAGKSIATFQMKDVVQQRWFMASLGAEGRGLFSPLLGREERRLERDWSGRWDDTHCVGTIQKGEGKISQTSDIAIEDLAPPQYTEKDIFKYMQEPTYQSIQEIKQHMSGQLQQPLQEGSNILNRPQHDSFLPPLGQPVNVLISVGYGLEVDLEPGVQELWDPVGNTRLFIDHNNQQTFYQDPRPPKPEAIRIACKQVVFGPDKKDPRIAQTNRSEECVSYHADRAKKKKHLWAACIIAKGRDGAQGKLGGNGAPGILGQNGHPGITSMSGFPGNRGQDGYPGTHGWPGQDGGHGASGSNGSDMSIFLSGDAQNLIMNGSSEGSLQLGGEGSEYIAFIDCSGGTGGSGGNGGNGGNGGQGGGGGIGGNGGHGQNGGTSQCGGNGGNGGDGGNGGPGGNGGAGGRGGKGGNSGNGGLCAIQSSDAKLLHLIEVACNAGQPGNPGKEGKGGSGGIGGIGGTGGFGGGGGNGGPNSDHSGIMPSGFPGTGGQPGARGQAGYEGPEGQSAIKGNRNSHGGLTFVLVSPDWQIVLEQSAYRYNVHIDPQSLNIASAVDDGIIEPNEKILISRFSVENTGGMALPDGALASMVSSSTVKFIPLKVALPQLRQKQAYIVAQEFYGRIYDVPPPNKPGPYIGEAFFETRVDLLGRPFESAKTQHRLIVQYPIKIHHISSPENLGRGEQGRIDITLTNVSSLPYGNFPGSGGNLELRIHLDKRLSPISNIQADYYTIYYDPNIQDSFSAAITRIEPAAKLTISFNIAISNTAQLFERCPIQVDVMLRGKLVEYQQQSIRITPFYLPTNPPAEILFVTNHLITRREFVLWQRIFQILGVEVGFWDRDRYAGVSYHEPTGNRHEVSWVGKYGSSLILYPNANLQNLDPADLVDHLNDNNRVGTEQCIDNDSGAILIQSGEKMQDNFDQIKQYVKSICNAGQRITIEGKEYGGKHVSRPESNHILTKRNSIVKSLEVQSPNIRCYVTTEVTQPKRLKMLSFTYGSLEINRFPIETVSKFMIVSRPTSRFLSDDTNMGVSQKEIPLANNWAQTLVYVLYGIPTKMKIRILQGQTTENEVLFITPSGYKLSIADLAQLTLTKEIIAEVKCLRMNMPKLATLTACVLEDLESFVRNTSQVFAIITAVKIFAKENIPSKQKEIKLQVLEYCRQVKRRLIAFGGKQIGKQFSSVKSSSVKGKRLYYEDLIDQQNTFEPHLHNENQPNDDFDLTI